MVTLQGQMNVPNVVRVTFRTKKDRHCVTSAFLGSTHQNLARKSVRIVKPANTQMRLRGCVSHARGENTQTKGHLSAKSVPLVGTQTMGGIPATTVRQAGMRPITVARALIAQLEPSLRTGRPSALIAMVGSIRRQRHRPATLVPEAPTPKLGTKSALLVTQVAA